LRPLYSKTCNILLTIVLDQYNDVVNKLAPDVRAEIETQDKLEIKKEELRRKNVEYKLKKLREKEKDYLSPDEY
jgi:hypothetical protein